jgi:hypothetical protein
MKDPSMVCSRGRGASAAIQSPKSTLLRENFVSFVVKSFSKHRRLMNHPPLGKAGKIQ